MPPTTTASSRPAAGELRPTDEAATVASAGPGRPARLGLPDLGCGVGLRIKHYPHIFEAQPEVDFFEIISENFMVEGGRPLENLNRIRERYRVVQHGVSLGIGSCTPLDFEYLGRLKRLIRRSATPWVTDHLCWTRNDGCDLHDLLPLPLTPAVARHVAERARVVQDFLEVPLGLENASSYLSYRGSTMSEQQFVSEVVEQADCGLLLDVNNVFVSAFNHDFDARAYLNGLPHERVIQMHLAGHTHKGSYIIDTHSDFVIDAVWDLYRHACALIGPVSTLIEWDADIPAFEVVLGEARRAAIIRQQVFGERAA